MNKPLKLPLALLLACGLLAGCGKNPSDPFAPTSGATGGANEPAQVSQALASEPQLVDGGQFESADQTRIDAPAGMAAAINPLYFFRNITSVDRQFEFAFSDTDSTGRPRTALVTVHKYLRGTFNIVTGPRWRIAAASGVDVTSRGATTHVLKLEIKTASRDTVIENPLALFRLRSVLKLDPAEEVRLIVTTERSNDVVVLVRAGLRARFLNNGDNTYTLVWHAPPVAGLFHVGVNALSNGTLFDDQAPYDSQAWIVPFVVSPTVLAEYVP